MQRFNDLIKGLTGLTITLVLVIGVPTGLIAAIGSPLPTAWPGIDTISRHVTDGNITDAFIIKLLATIVWVAWAQLTAATISEYVSILRGKAASRAPALPAVRLLAAKLATWTTLVVTAIAPIRPALAVPLQPVSAIAMPLAPDATSHNGPVSPQAVSAPAVADGKYRTQRGDTWWDISERLLGNGIRWNEIRSLNLDARMPDGDVIAAHTDIVKPGWMLSVPADANLPGNAEQPADDIAEAVTVVVEGGDHFWSIAEEALTDAWGRSPTDAEIAPYWVELVAANKERLLPPKDPNLIYPDQTFIVTDTPRNPDLAADLNGADVLKPPPVVIEEPGRQAPEQSATPATQGEAQPETGVPSESLERPNPTMAPAEVTTETRSPVGGEDRSRIGGLIEDAKPIAAVASGLALLGTALLFTLRRLRHIQAARRRPGSTIDPPDDEAAAFEERIRAIATDGEDVRYLAAANAYLSHQLENASTPIPSLIAARAGKFGLEFLLDEPCKPVDGFIAVNDDETTWRLRADIDARIMESEVTDAHPFAPALSVAGTTEGGALLLDLEQLGAVAIEGHPERVADFQRGLVASVCVAPWAAQCEIVTIGIDGMQGEHLSRLTIPQDPRAWAAQTSEEMTGIARSLDRSPYEERIDHGSVYYPTIVFVGPDEPLAAIGQHLAPIAQLAYAPLVVVSAHPLTSEYRILLHDDTATLEPFGLGFDPVTLPAEDLAAIDHLISNATETEASPPAEDWANDVAEADHAGSNGQVAPDIADAAPPVSANASEPPIAVNAESAPSEATVDAIAAILGPKPIEVRILGRQAAIEGLRGDAAPKVRAIIAYLAFHGEVVGRRLRDEFWPGSDSRQACDNAMVKIRSLLGIGTEDQQRLETIRATSSYRVSDEVGLDWHRVEQLTEASKNQLPADEAAYLDAACEMIDGHVAADAKPDLYGWLLREPTNYTLIETTLIDAAHRRGQLALSSGDVERANWAAQKGLEIVEGQEAMYRMKMKAASEAGDVDGVNTAYRHARRAAESYGFDEGVQPETQELYDKLTRAGKHSRDSDSARW